MLVLCTGMPRSGSTWSYNVVRRLFGPASSAVRCGYMDAVGDALRRHGSSCEHMIVKSHAPDDVARALIKQRACRTVYTYREPRDSILSAMEAFVGRFDEQVDRTKASLDLMRFQVEAGGVLCVWYGDLVERPQDVVQAIADYLELDLPADAIAEVATMLSRDNVRRIIKALGKSAAQAGASGAQWDGGTLFSNHHVRAHPSNPADVFSAEQIARIAEGLSGYVGADAVLRPEIRALGMLDNAPLTTTRWPEPVAPAPTAETEPAEAPPVEASPVEASPVEGPAAEGPATDVPAVAAPTVVMPPAVASPEAPPESAAAVPAELASEPPEAPSIGETPAPPEAPPAEPAPTPAAARPVAAPPKAAPNMPPYDPGRAAARRALARDLLHSLGRLQSGKSRAPGAGR